MNEKLLVTSPASIARRIDIERIVDTIRYYTNKKSSVVIFEFGSCVFPPLGKGALYESVSLLKNLPSGLGFNVREMDDKNFVVSFGEFVCAIVFKDELDALRVDVEIDIEDSDSGEIIVGRSEVPREHLYIGIIARTRLINDIKRLVVAETIGTKIA